jgi:hypothetical protein
MPLYLLLTKIKKGIFTALFVTTKLQIFENLKKKICFFEKPNEDLFFNLAKEKRNW